MENHINAQKQQVLRGSGFNVAQTPKHQTFHANFDELSSGSDLSAVSPANKEACKQFLLAPCLRRACASSRLEGRENQAEKENG